MSLAVGVVCFPSLGGSGVIAADLAHGLAERGHRVHLMASEPPSRPLTPVAGLTFVPITAAEYPLLDHPPYALAVASAIVELCRRQHLDLVHVHYAVPHAASAFLARQVLGPDAPKVITSLHGTDVTRVGQEPSYREVTRFCVRASDAITVPSVFLRDEARRLFDLDGKIEVIPNFVDTRGFTPPASRPAEAAAPVLVHVSNFRPVKRTTDLIEVLARVRRHLPARLVLIGDGPDRAATEARARDLGVAGATRFVGRRAEIAATLQEADAFLLTSESESFGVAALEAMSCGVPVFGYAVGGLPEVVGEQAGRLVAPHDVAALADAILALLGDREAWRAASTAARERAVGSFGREAILDRYQAFYRRLLARETP